MAIGNFGQYPLEIPDRNLVVVHRVAVGRPLIRAAIDVCRRARAATCSGLGEVWMTVRFVMTPHRAGCSAGVGERVARGGNSEQRREEGECAVSEGDLR